MWWDHSTAVIMGQLLSDLMEIIACIFRSSVSFKDAFQRSFKNLNWNIYTLFDQKAFRMA